MEFIAVMMVVLFGRPEAVGTADVIEIERVKQGERNVDK